MIKAVLLFLIVMGVIAVIGNAIQPGFARDQIRKRLGLQRPQVCSRCKADPSNCGCKKV